MPKAVTLYNQHIKVEKGSEIDAQASDEDGPVVKEMWTFVFTDKTYHDQIRISFDKDSRDSIIKDLMGGVILPGV